MRKISLFLAVMVISTYSFAATVTWTGAAGNSDWSNAFNWDTFSVPVAGDIVLITSSSDMVELSGTATIQRIRISGGADLHIMAGAVLNVTGATAEEAFETTGTGNVIINDGTLNVSMTTNSSKPGLYNKGMFTNNGAINISNTAGDGMYCQDGVFTNAASGTITITGSSRDHIRTDNNGTNFGILNNDGTITITVTSGDEAIYVNDGSTFNNNGMLTIDGSAGGDQGIQLDNDGVDGATFNNLANGNLVINTTVDDAIYTQTTTIFNNSGMVTITNAGMGSGSSEHGFLLEGTLNNLASGTIKIINPDSDAIRVDASPAGTFTNAGTLILEEAPNGDSIENEGTATYSAGSTIEIGCNNDIEILELKCDHDLGPSCITFDIAGADALGGTSNQGVSYDAIKNYGGSACTSDMNISGVTAKLDFSYTTAVDDCFTIIDGSGTLTGEFSMITLMNSNIQTYTVDYSDNTEVEICVTAIEGCGSSAVALSGAGTITATTSCDDGPWSYYEDPGNPGNYLFAIEWDAAGTGNNATAKANATVSVTLDPAIGSAVAGTDGTWTMKRYWDVSGATLVDPVNVKFFYDTAEKTEIENAQAAHGGTLEAFTWFKTVGSSFDPTAINPVSVGQGSIILTDVSGGAMENGVLFAQFDGITSFSGGSGAIGSGAGSNALPVEFAYFTGEKTDRGTKLGWMTYTEINNEGFEVERSIDNKNWKSIGFVKGNGNSTKATEYSYLDSEAHSGIVYYRLKQMDFDGRFEYSDVLTLTYDGRERAIAFYPNPVKETLFIDNPSLEDIEVNIFDVNGKTVHSASGALYQISMDQFDTGMYFINIKSASGETTHKLIHN